tara:strand:+ start:2358 stop:3221 length:864 start_codon:yes stop_codon:yes gene_type:complete
MVEYKCERCHYVAKQKGDIKKHFKRKNICRAIHSDISVEELLEKLNKPKEGFACSKCNKIFKTSQGKYQHQKRCKQELVVYKETNQDEKIQELVNKLVEEKMKNINSITNIGKQEIKNQEIKNQKNITNNNTNLFISFNDKENIHKVLKQCQETILLLEQNRSKDKCFSIYLTAAHFNPEHPEMHNIKLTNLKPDYKLIDIRDEHGKWKKEPQKEIFNNLINSSKDFITDIVKDNNPEFENTDSIDEYDGEDTKEKYVLYCNEKNYKDKLENLAKSEVYNKSREIKS